MDIIQTDRLVFREFTQADIDKLFLILSDPIERYTFIQLTKRSKSKE